MKKSGAKKRSVPKWNPPRAEASFSEPTPGPWIAAKAGRITDASGGVVAIVTPERPAPSDLPRVEANARLIAAAPEMRRLLQSFIDAWDSEGDEFTEGTETSVNEARALRDRIGRAKAP